MLQAGQIPDSNTEYGKRTRFALDAFIENDEQASVRRVPERRRKKAAQQLRRPLPRNRHQRAREALVGVDIALSHTNQPTR